MAKGLNRQLSRFGMYQLGLRLEDFELDKSVRRSTSEPLQKKRRINQMVKYVADHLIDSQKNLSVINKRLKLKRLAPDFYLHQQFVINLGKKDLSKMVDIYFELPEPRALYLTSFEFEKFMSQVLAYKMSKEDHILDSEKLVDLFKNLLDDHIPLTGFELTKYVFFTLKNMSSLHKLDKDSCFNGVMQLQSRFIFTRSIWNLILNEFPEKRDIVLKEMANKVTLNRDLLITLLKTSTSISELANLLGLVQLKHIHLDPQMFELILRKLIGFGYYFLAKGMLETLLTSRRPLKMDSFSEGVPIFPTRVERKLARQYEAFNGSLLYRARSAPPRANKVDFSRLIYYYFKPSPMICSVFLDSLCDSEVFTEAKKFEVNNILELMIKNKIPLINSQLLNVLSKLLVSLPENLELDMKMVLQLNDLALSSIEYNERLHANSKDFKYDKKYLSSFIKEQVGNSVVNELRSSFKLSFELFRKWPAEGIEGFYYEMRIEVKEKMLKIYDELEIVEE
ncbi:hypothetical protein FOA43_002722 [Brettanomyces nanus]|uniref:Uncharacterized protein n=1 Tax=Eeniella nana TaxID=13502 RepID=A0A875S6L6_EENNA|nr:uncharacterized protein FOA43_002722 [Brettanomyces nanus]QPG75369.1 hypothetical protein FOA43_002722 [Brettanomyces nanus]